MTTNRPTNGCATLLMDLQVDFLAARDENPPPRLPVDAAGAARVIATANAVLSGRAGGPTLPLLVLNQYPKDDTLGNLMRRHAAIRGSMGARLDPRIQASPRVPMFAKSAASAFSNPELDAWLKPLRIRRLQILGVFAEGCVLATALDAVQRGYEVVIPVDAIASNSRLKKWFALWSLKRSGVTLVPSLLPER